MKRDNTTIFGLLVGTVCILYAMTLGGSLFARLRLFFNFPAIALTVFGSTAAVIMSFPFSTIKKLPKVIKIIFVEKEISKLDLIDKLVELSKKSRKEGLLSLEDDIENLDDAFFRDGLQMVVDGAEPETIREIMDLEIEQMEARHGELSSVFKLWSNLAPAFGMIGTLLALVIMFTQLSDMDKLAENMAFNFISSFYGAVMANFIMTPISRKLDIRNDEEVNLKEMMIEGVLAVQSGVNPKTIEDKLKTFLNPEEKLQLLNHEVRKETVMESE